MIDAVAVAMANREALPLSRISATRDGYTLLEMLLAVSLMTILIAAITITTGSFVQLSSKSRIQIKQAFAVDCIIDDLILDLKATARSTHPTSTSERTEATSMPTPGLSVGTERVLQWNSSEERSYVSFVGNSRALLITRDGLNPRFAGQAVGQQFTTSTDSTQHLLWMAPSISQVTLDAEISGSQCINRTFTRPENSLGLLRAYVHGLQLKASMATSEIVAMQFRYWDGNRWLESWNSFTQADQLPDAIEIRVRLKTDPENWRRFLCNLERQQFYGAQKGSDITDGFRP